jgi:hypothetical protein
MGRLKHHAVSSAVRVIVIAAGVTAPAVAWANVPPSPSLSRTPAAWVGFAFMFVLLALVLGVSLLPSKRGHQD